MVVEYTRLIPIYTYIIIYMNIVPKTCIDHHTGVARWKVATVVCGSAFPMHYLLYTSILSPSSQLLYYIVCCCLGCLDTCGLDS